MYVVNFAIVQLLYIASSIVEWLFNTKHSVHIIATILVGVHFVQKLV